MYKLLERITVATIMEFHQDLYVPSIQELFFTYHMYKLLERITVATCAERHSSVVQISKMCCAVFFKHNVYYPALHTKLNLNYMMVIGMCLFKTSLWNTSVLHNKKHPHLLCTFAHIMLCFTRFSLIKANKMQLQQLFIAKKSLIFCKT